MKNCNEKKYVPETQSPFPPRFGADGNEIGQGDGCLPATIFTIVSLAACAALIYWGGAA